MPSVMKSLCNSLIEATATNVRLIHFMQDVLASGLIELNFVSNIHLFVDELVVDLESSDVLLICHCGILSV